MEKDICLRIRYGMAFLRS